MNEAQREPLPTFAESLVQALVELGIRQAFGVVGGAIAHLCDALGAGALAYVHCRHESGAAFAATEAHFASGRPTLVFVTSGPGLTNVLTGITAARWEGAKVLVLSATTPAPVRGRWACQETSGHTTPAALLTSGEAFDFAVALEHPAELALVLRRLAAGFAAPGGFVAHVAVPTSLQGARIAPPRPVVADASPPCCDDAAIARHARSLASAPFVIWAGFGARHASRELLELAERTGALVMATPRAKGIFPERHRQYLGVTGIGGHEGVDRHFLARRPAHVLVLGTRLGEPSSYWQEHLVPSGGFIHVDVDPRVPGSAYPTAATYAVTAEVGAFLRALLRHDGFEARRPAGFEALPPPPRVDGPGRAGVVRALALMDSVQRVIVDASDATVLTESGNAFAWGNHALRFDTPGRYRVSVGFGSMGHACAGVLGAALGRREPAVALVGDGAMLMLNELSTAVAYGARAVWVVLNDGRYGMVEHGMRALGLRPVDTNVPRVDFVGYARSLGARGVVVDREDALDDALRAAMSAAGPFVVDVRTDPDEAGPWMRRIESLIAQGAGARREEPTR